MRLFAFLVLALAGMLALAEGAEGRGCRGGRGKLLQRHGDRGGLFHGGGGNCKSCL